MALATGQITINNIEETISVVFSKDNHVFPGGVSSALAGSVDISVKAYIGTEEVAYTFGTITPAAPTGLTITPSSTNKKITFTATGSLTQASGTYNVQVIVKGVIITKTLSYAISFKGTAGKGISSTAIAYQAHTNGTTAPTGTWSASPPVVADNQYLWTRTIITYTDTTTSTSYSVGKMGRGSNGTDGIDGADAKLATIVASSKIFKSRDGGATFSPDSITLTPVFQGGITYSNWQYSTNGGSTWTTVTTQNGLSINSTTKVLTIAKTSTLFTTLITDIVFRVNTNISTVYDTVNITKIYDVVDLTQKAIFDKLTNNGAEQGLFLDGGKVYLNGEYLKVTNLVAGDALIQNGHINTAFIDTASITSAKIASLAANKIDAATLSAITADVGTLTAGLLKNSTGTTYLNLTDGTFKLGSALEYNGSALNITANSIKIGATSVATTTDVSNGTKDLVASSIVEYYLSTSSTSPTGGSWSETAPAWANGKFMWSRTKVTTKAGAVTYHPNENGTNITGASGATGRGIASTEIHYAVSSSGTVTPTSWGTTIPAIAPEQYLWTRTTVNYDSGSPSVSYSIGQAGKGGASGADGRSITSSEVHYQKSTSGTTVPTGTWLTSIPTVAASEYLWTRTTFNYSSGPTPVHSYSVGKMGDTGRGITSITTEYYLSTSNTSQVNGSWSTTPPAFDKAKYLWTRSNIAWRDPTGRTTTTPELSTEWNTLADHETRVYNAEQAITPTSIKSTVSALTNSEGKPFFAQTSVVNQTVSDWTATFSEIGGRNLLLKSKRNLTNNTYQHSDYYFGEEIPKAGDTYTVTVKFSLGAGRTSLSLYSSGGYRAVASFTNADRDSNGIASKTFTMAYAAGRTPAEGYNYLTLYQMPNTGTSNTTVEWINLERGSVSTDWSQAPEEFVEGVTRINKDGITVAKSNQDINSHLGANGLIISEGERDAPGSTAIAGFTDGGAWIGNLKADSIEGNIINTHPGGTINIGEGRDFTTINEALTAIGNRKHLLGDLVFNVYNTIIEDITIRGFSGGMIYIRILENGAIHGDITFYQNSAGAYLLGVGGRKLVKGGIKITGGNAYIQSLIVSPGNTTTTGIVSEYGSQVYIMDCDIVNVRFAVLAQQGATIMALNNIGAAGAGQAVYNTYNGGVLHARGTMPMGSPKFGGTTTAFQYDFTTSQQPSQYQPPTAVPTPISQTFSATTIETYSYQYGAISSYYPNRAAQNRWDTGTGYFEGRIFFSGALRNYINDRDGDANLNVELQVRRYSGTNGSSSGVAPDNQFAITGGSFGLVKRGAWSGWVTISPTLITTSGYTFKFGSQSTGSKYAVWDDARIRVVKTKDL